MEAEYSEFLCIFTLRIYCTSFKGVTKKSPSKYVTYTSVLQTRTEDGIPVLRHCRVKDVRTIRVLSKRRLMAVLRRQRLSPVNYIFLERGFRK